MKNDFEKVKTLMEEMGEASLELCEKLEREVLDPDMCCLDFDTRNKAEAIYQCLFRAYSLAAEYLDEREN